MDGHDHMMNRIFDHLISKLPLNILFIISNIIREKEMNLLTKEQNLRYIAYIVCHPLSIFYDNFLSFLSS